MRYDNSEQPAGKDHQVETPWISIATDNHGLESRYITRRMNIFTLSMRSVSYYLEDIDIVPHLTPLHTFSALCAVPDEYVPHSNG